MEIYSDQFCVHRQNPLLHGLVEAFNLWNVLVFDECVQINIHISEHCSGQLKLLIFPQFHYLETPLHILGIDGLYGLNSQISLWVLLPLCGEPDVLAVSVDERDAAHKHVVSRYFVMSYIGRLTCMDLTI